MTSLRVAARSRMETANRVPIAVPFASVGSVAAGRGSCYHCRGRGTTMTVATEPTVRAGDAAQDIPDVPIYRLSVAQYHAMVGAGILNEDAPVELLEGWLVQKMTKYRP